VPAILWLSGFPILGEHFTFRCSQCGYSAEISGGSDAGYSFCTQTILCFECKELMDIVTAVVRGEQQAGMEITGEIADSPLLNVRMKCEKDSSHHWREWNSPDVCPRCNNPMSHDPNLITLWD
jgi:hypothetical protein